MDKYADLYIVLISAMCLLLCLCSFIIYFIFLYKNKQTLHRREQESLQSAFNQELLKTQIEVQEQTLTNISREIHDNITQVLSFVKLNLGMIESQDDFTVATIAESRELVAQTIHDLRNLSKSLSFEHIAGLGLIKTVEIEAGRINNSGLLNMVVVVAGEGFSLGDQRELVLFRIFQEALNNTLKYSGAKHLKINLQYSEKLFTLTLEDDGVGFSAELVKGNTGAGLKNMQSRATLIGANIIIDSAPGKGCSIKVILNSFDRYPNGHYSNSPG